MDGMQGWHLVILANLVVIAAVVFLISWYFRSARKRRAKQGMPARRRDGEGT